MHQTSTLHDGAERAYESFDLAQLVEVHTAVAPTHLYIARRLKNGTAGERFFLCTLPDGALIMPMSSDKYMFIAVPTVASAGLPVAPADAQALVLWQTAVGTARFLARPSPDMMVAEAGKTLHLDAQDLVTAGAPLWAVVPNPDLLIATTSGVVQDTPTSLTAAPVGPGWVLRANANTSVQFMEVKSLLNERGLGVINEAAAVWAQLAACWLEAELKREEEQAQDALAQSRRNYEQSLERVAAAAVGVDTVSAAEEKDDPLLAALSILGESQGIPIVAPPPDERANTAAEQLGRFAEASQFRYRLVTLRGAWWEEPGVPLLASRQDGSSLALLPARHGYTCRDPVAGEETAVDAAIAAQLQDQAYMIYATFPTVLTGRTIAGFALKIARQDMWWMIGAALGVALIGLLVPIVTGFIVGRAILEARFSLLAELVLILVAVAVGTTLFQAIQGLASVRLSAHIDLRLQPAVWDRVMRLPINFFRGYGVGDLTLRVLGIKTISTTLSSTAIGAVLAGILSLTSFFVMALYDVPLTLFAVIYALAIAILLAVLTRNQLKWTRRIFFLQGHVETLVLQILSGISKLRVAAAEERAFTRWANAYASQRSNQTHAAVIRNVTDTLMLTLPILGSIGVFLIAGSRASTLNVAAFIAFNAAFGQFMAATLTLSQAVTNSLNVVPLYDRVQPVLEAAPEIDRRREDPGRLSGAIAVRNVSFSYHADGSLVLQNVSCDVAPGQFVAVVGPSGAGKSTMLRLLLGFESPTKGAIYYDGKDLATLDLLRVRRQIGTVLQSVGLIPGSIYENIAGASPLSREQVLEAARMAGLEADIKAMSMGLETIVSEGGGNLSGGQQQRLMIARVLVRKPRIIFFDEATSALDNRTQATVTENLERFRTTRIVIAHRLSTIRRADKILVVDQGRIVQQGTFDELIAVDGLFKQLAERQIA